MDVIVQLPNERISTTYGVGKKDTQDENGIVMMGLNAGLKLIHISYNTYGFYLRFQKRCE